MFFRKREKGIKKIVVGLGNPGKKYEQTRHNAGFLALKKLEKAFNFKLKKIRFKALTDTSIINGKNVLFMAPQTFMNLSGDSVFAAADYYNVLPKDIITISDDVELDVGILRIRRKGSHGGQKGLRDIYEIFETNDIPRIKIGVGKKPHKDFDMSDWVLSNFSKKEKDILDETLEDLEDIVELLVDDDIDKAMNLFSK